MHLMACSTAAVAGGFLLLAAACSDPEAGVDAGVPNCPTGTKAVQTACVPVFDVCKKDEVSVPGGGCKKVGVQECSDGITGLAGLKGPPDWTCKTIGPPTTCLTGWQKVSGGWCEPLYAADKCPAGSMAVIGKSTCQPIGDCGTGTWGKITTTAATVHVNGAYTGGGSDGSQAKPFTTIGAALAKVGYGGHIVVAAGTYREDVAIKVKGVTLDGVCARLVTIKGQTADQALDVLAQNTTLRGLTLTGPGKGLTVQPGADGALIEQVAVLDTGEYGVDLYAGATLRDCLVQGAGEVGLSSERLSSQAPLQLTLRRVTVRDTLPPKVATQNEGRGVDLRDNVKADISHSLLLANYRGGLRASGAELTLTGSVVAANLEDPAWTTKEGRKLSNGTGVYLGQNTRGRPPSRALARATLRDCLIKENRTHGIVAAGGSTLRLERSIIRDNRPSLVVAGEYGDGIFAGAALTPPSLASVTVSDSLLSGNARAGINLQGAVAVVERSLVRDTAPKKSATLAMGIGVALGGGTSRLTIKDSLLAGNTFAGFALFGGAAQLDRVVIRDTRPGAIGVIKPGYGIRVGDSLKARPRLTLRDSSLSGNTLQDLCLLAADAVVERSLLRGSGKVSPDSDGATIGVLAYNIYNTAAGRSDLKLTETAVVDHQLYGVQSVGSKVTLERSLVRDTRYTKEAGKGGGYGLGAAGGSLVLEDSLVSGNHTSGVVVSGAGTTLELRRSAVVGTNKSLDGYGDGVLASGGASMKLQDSLVDRSARVGLLFDRSGGRVSRSLLRAGIIGLVLKGGAAPTIDGDVVFLDNKEERAQSNMQVAQPPTVPPPPSL